MKITTYVLTLELFALLAFLVTLEIGSALAFFLGSLVTALAAGLPAYFSYRVSMKTDQKVDRIEATGAETHKAVNSTASALAQEKILAEARELELVKRVSQLEEANRMLMGQRTGPKGEQGVPGVQGQTGRTG